MSSTPVQPALHEQRRRHPAGRRFAAEDEGLLHVVRVASPGADPGGLLRRVVEQVAHLPLTEARGAAGRRRGAEDLRGAVRAAVGERLVGRPAHAHRHARADVVAERDRAQEVHARRAELLAERERGRHRRAARMRARRAVRVVGLVGVRQHPVRERRLDRAAHKIGSGDRRHGLPAVAARKRDRRAPRRQAGPRDHRGDRVQNVVLGLLEHRLRQRAVRASLMYALRRAMTGLMASAAIERRRGGAAARINAPVRFRIFRRLTVLRLMRPDHRDRSRCAPAPSPRERGGSGMGQSIAYFRARPGDTRRRRHAVSSASSTRTTPTARSSATSSPPAWLGVETRRTPCPGRGCSRPRSGRDDRRRNASRSPTPSRCQGACPP